MVQKSNTKCLKEGMVTNSISVSSKIPHGNGYANAELHAGMMIRIEYKNLASIETSIQSFTNHAVMN